MAKNTVSIRIDPKTRSKLEDLSIEISWVILKNYDDKIDHLVWLYENQKFNNQTDSL